MPTSSTYHRARAGRPGSRSLWIAGIVAVSLAAATVAGCSGDDEGSRPTPSTTPRSTSTTGQATTTSETTGPSTPEEAVLAAVDGYWQSFLDANNPPNPDHPGLARYRTGEALRVAVENVRERQQLGHYVRLPEDSVFSRRTGVIEQGLESTQVRDCVVDDSELVEIGSEVVLNSEVETSRYLLTLRLEDGHWKVAEVLLEGQWDGETECEPE